MLVSRCSLVAGATSNLVISSAFSPFGLFEFSCLRVAKCECAQTSIPLVGFRWSFRGGGIVGSCVESPIERLSKSEQEAHLARWGLASKMVNRPARLTRIGGQRWPKGGSRAYLHPVTVVLNMEGYVYFRLRCESLGLSMSEAVRESMIASGLLRREFSLSTARRERRERRQKLGLPVRPKGSKRGKGSEVSNGYASSSPDLE